MMNLRFILIALLICSVSCNFITDTGNPMGPGETQAGAAPLSLNPVAPVLEQISEALCNRLTDCDATTAESCAQELGALTGLESNFGLPTPDTATPWSDWLTRESQGEWGDIALDYSNSNTCYQSIQGATCELESGPETLSFSNLTQWLPESCALISAPSAESGESG
jgi:hypothetical protein